MLFYRLYAQFRHAARQSLKISIASEKLNDKTNQEQARREAFY